MILEARIAGAAMGRSIAGQVEFWASLGREMERIMNGGQIIRVGETATTAAELSKSLESVNELEGRARLAAYLESTPFPHYAAHPTKARVFLRTDADGTVTEGRFAGRDFVPSERARATEAA
jgi:hypothetical protein